MKVNSINQLNYNQKNRQQSFEAKCKIKYVDNYKCAKRLGLSTAITGTASVSVAAPTAVNFFLNPNFKPIDVASMPLLVGGAISADQGLNDFLEAKDAEEKSKDLPS